MSKYFGKFASIALALWMAISPAQATDISNLPVESQNAVKPNIIFGLDDSGSMDFEVLLPTNDGALWWSGSTQSFLNGTAFNFHDTGVSSSTMRKYAYLFPNGCGDDTRELCDGTNDHFAVPPVDAYAYVRSADYNPMYYNPAVTYRAWAPALLSGSTLTTYASATATKALSHPIYPAGASMDLTALQAATAGNNTFRMLPGMTIPGSTISGVKGRKKGAGGYNNVTTNYTIPANEYWDVAIPYYPATYWVRDDACASNCSTGPDGKKIKKYEVKAGNTFPSGRSYADELQNFANWFTYHRKRKMMLSAAMGEVLPQVAGIRGGIVRFNNRTAPTMFDFSSKDNTKNYNPLLGSIYSNPSSGGTPTRETLNYIGNQYSSNNSVIQYACQKNAAFILTDGFAYANTVTPPAYDKNIYGKNAPYQTTYASTLADIALSYYTNHLRSDMTKNLVPIDVSDPSPNADKNRDLHMNTYGLTLGAKGTIYPTTTDPFVTAPTWPNPNQDRNPTSVDDLWHATINGRGAMFTATDTQSLIDQIKEIILDVMVKAGAQSAVAVSSVNLKDGDNFAYVSSYNVSGWFGDVASYPIDVNTGAVDLNKQVWSVKDKVASTAYDKRLIAAWNGVKGIEFTPTAVNKTITDLINPGGIYGDNTKVINYLRGDKSNEGTLFRKRNFVFGDVIHAEPVVVKTPAFNYTDTGYVQFRADNATRKHVIYQAANDGMIHAIDKETGSELWAYIPGLAQNKLGYLSSKTYAHTYYLDGTPVSADISVGGGSWKTVLVGGAGYGNSGYYALDVTAPTPSSAIDVGKLALWEFHGGANMGISAGKPVLGKLKDGTWVAVVAGGYNPGTGNDGKGHVWVLNANTGAVIEELITPKASTGLAHISGYSYNSYTDGTLEAVYGGDENGQLWKFDMSDKISNKWSVVQIAELAVGGKAQPITTAPELYTLKDGTRVIYVGTGRLMGDTDVSNTDVQSMYAIEDTGAVVTRSTLRENKITWSGTYGRMTAGDMDWTKYDGWYFDFVNSGERAVTEASIAFGALIFTTNQPSAIACSSNSYLYAVDLLTGGEFPPSNYSNMPQPWAGKKLGQTLANKAVPVITKEGNIAAITHLSNNTVDTSTLATKATKAVRKTSWRQVIR